MTVIDDYIQTASPAKQPRLRQVQAAIKAELPDATEKLSYNMPTYWQGQNLIHFAAFKHHIGIYPTPSALAAFAAEVADFPHSKGAMQIPDDRALPLDLIRRMARFRLAEEQDH